jgi:phosphoglycolate phosphatase
MQKPDSLIFDMDGTLWDAVDTYAHSWNVVFTEMGIDKVIEPRCFGGYGRLGGQKGDRGPDA